jgi:hypothetical protein
MKTLIAVLVTFFMISKISAQQNNAVSAKIITENKEGQIKLKAVASNQSDLYSDLNYIMVSVKKGKGGNSTNKQSGKFSLNPKETKTLSEMNINLSKNDGLKVFLFLKNEETDQVVSKDSLEINGKEFTSDVSYIPESNLELTGLTIDDTKTRIGQIFYDSFFKKYNQISQKFEGTITISEMPTFGRNTRILLTVDDQLIHAFLSKPDEESLDAEADKALANLIEYNSRNSLRNKEFKY